MKVVWVVPLALLLLTACSTEEVAEPVGVPEDPAPAPVAEAQSDCGSSDILDQEEPVVDGDTALICFGKNMINCEESTLALSYKGDTQTNDIIPNGDGTCAIKVGSTDGTYVQCPVPEASEEDLAEIQSDNDYANAAFGMIVVTPLMALDPDAGCTSG